MQWAILSCDIMPNQHFLQRISLITLKSFSKILLACSSESFSNPHFKFKICSINYCTLKQLYKIMLGPSIKKSTFLIIKLRPSMLNTRNNPENRQSVYVTKIISLFFNAVGKNYYFTVQKFPCNTQPKVYFYSSPLKRKQNRNWDQGTPVFFVDKKKLAQENIHFSTYRIQKFFLVCNFYVLIIFCSYQVIFYVWIV